MFKTLAAIGLLLCALASPAAAANLVLVEDGQARAQVVIPDDASDRVRDLAGDFARVLARMSGARLPVVKESVSDPTQARVLIGACRASAGLDADPGAIRGDEAYAGYVIACDGKNLVLRGNTPAGTTNAVYGFLQDELGVRWFLPTELFEVVPTRRTVAVPEMRRVATPSFVCRLGSASWNPEALAWSRRNRWDTHEGGWEIPYAAGFRHWMYAVFPPSKYGKSHPEIYPLINGKRAIPSKDGEQLAQPCTGNPETVRIAIAEVNAYLDAHPECHTYPFGINDNNTWCECDLCKAQDVERPLYRGRKIYSDRWYTFVNAVARGVRARHPDKFIGCFAYAGVELPPIRIERMEPNVFINLTQDTAQYFDSAYRKVDYDLIRAWQQKCDHVGKYDYYGLGALAPRVFPHLLARDLKAIHAMGVRAFHSELYPYWAHMGPMLYVASRLLWDVRLDPDRLLREFYSAFGPAAGEIRAFYETHEAAWMSQKTGKWFGGLGSAGEQMDFYTPARAARAAEHLRRAKALATDETTQARVDFIARSYAYPDLLLRGWTTARAIGEAAPRRPAEARALAGRVETLLEALDGEETSWKKSIADDPLADRWYQNGGRPQIRSQWRSRVQTAMLDGLHALASWEKSPAGQKAAPETRALFDRIAAHPQAGFLWKAMRGTLALGPNLLPNPGFEEAKGGQLGPTGPDWKSTSAAAGWSTWQENPHEGRFFLDTNEKHGGNAAGAFQGGGCLCYITTVPIETGKRYLAQVWVRKPVAREGTAVALEIRWNDAAGRWYNGAANLRLDARKAGVWEQLQIPFMAPPGAARVVILLTGYGIEKEDVVRFDNAFLGEARE
ncbi:MAG TPA: DUF4838 domain-containing protein [Armatimonadota bacterium]|nr:DUF4838 domain-containing protein [Armatimonadota bacterium]